MRSGIMILLVLCGTASVGLEPLSDRTTAFVHVNVLPMTAEVVLRDQTVVVRDGKIAEIGPSSDVDVPGRADVIQAGGKYLMPGLSDLHVHFFGGRRGNPDILTLFVANGVTSILNMRGARGILELREQVAEGELLGPAIYTASPIQGNVSPNPKTFELGVKAVEAFAEEGYDFIKVYNLIPKEGYEGIMDTAKRLNMPVVGHAVRAVGIEGAIRTGQHIAHMEEIIYGYFFNNLDESRIEPLAQQLKNANISVIATLVTYHNIIRQVEDIDAMLDSPGIEYLSDGMMRGWQPDRNDYLRRFNQVAVDKRLRPAFEFQQKLAKAFVDAGVPVLTGTDACIPIVIPGYSMHQELVELVEAGLSPYQALEAGTHGPARFLGGENTFGTIETGKQADLVLLDRNPLDDIRKTREIAGVMLRGKWLDRLAIDELLLGILIRKRAE